MGLSSFQFSTLVNQVVDAIPLGESKPGCWNARRAFQGVLGLVRAGTRTSIKGMLERQFDLGLFPDFTDCPAASGFSQARHLLQTSDFQAGWGRAKKLVGALVSPPGKPRWIAIDGGSMVTSRSPSARRRWNTPTGGKLPQALVVTAWEVRTHLPVGFCVLPGGQGERAGVDELMPHLRPSDVVLMDRGFPSERLIGTLVDQDIDIVVRMTTGENAWAETTAFIESGEDDAVLPVEVRDPDGRLRRILMRFIRRTFPRGRPKRGQGREMMVIATTLLDASTHSAKAILARYDERWGVETAYREMKITFAIEHFHSEDADFIIQELYALMTWLCLAAAMEAQVKELLIAKRGPIEPTDPHRWQINRTHLFSKVDRAFWAACVPGAWEKHQTTYERHCRDLVRSAQKRRPGRSRPRERLAPFGRLVRGK
jgi:Transposase DDE domain